jgi:chemotaxis protein MotB
MAAKAQNNIIRKVEIIEGHGHHGGAWKVAYADFMTAMMAFFLLLWILSSSDEQKLRGIAEYFTEATMPGGSGVLDGATLGPPGVLSASNGAVVARGSDLGKIDDPSPAQWEVRDITPTADPEEKVLGTNKGVHEYPAAGEALPIFETKASSDVVAQKSGDGASEMNAAGNADDARETEFQNAAAGSAETAQDSEENAHAQDKARFENLQAQITQAIQDNPDLRPLKANVVFEKTPEGLRIQIIDQEGKPMFSSGRAEMTKATRILMEKLGESLTALPNKMVISGHTDAVPFSNRRAYDNWDLSSDRANATRRQLEAAGVKRERIIRVSGMADTELLVKDDPKHASNRRISILLQYEKAEDDMWKRPAQTSQKPAPTDAAPAKAMKAEIKDPAKVGKPMKAASAKPAPVQQSLTLLDEQVFENLRSALR